MADRRRGAGGGTSGVHPLQNRESVSFNWLFWTFDAPLWLVLVITALVAFVIGQFALMWRRHKRRQACRAGR